MVYRGKYFSDERLKRQSKKERNEDDLKYAILQNPKEDSYNSIPKIQKLYETSLMT